jgi:hypothetical protein
MPALASVNVSTPFIEVPQNALRVLLTAYGVSLTVQKFDGHIYPLLFTDCRHKVSPPRDILRTRHGSLSPRLTTSF